MSYNVETSDSFERQAKSLFKRYKSLKGEISRLVDMLADEPNTGTAIGKSCYKIIVAIKS